MTHPVKPRAEKLRLDKTTPSITATPPRANEPRLSSSPAASSSGSSASTKPGTTIPADSVIRLLGSDLKYVSRGGLKLERALDTGSISLTRLACVDIGASTGGFTELHAAKRRTLCPRGRYRLRPDRPEAPRRPARHPPRAHQRTPPRAPANSSPPTYSASLRAMDVSFISATLVLPAVISALSTPENPWQGEPSSSSSPSSKLAVSTSARVASYATRSSPVRYPARPRLCRRAIRHSHRHLDSPIKGMEATTNTSSTPSSAERNSGPTQIPHTKQEARNNKFRAVAVESPRHNLVREPAP